MPADDPRDDLALSIGRAVLDHLAYNYRGWTDHPMHITVPRDGAGNAAIQAWQIKTLGIIDAKAGVTYDDLLKHLTEAHSRPLDDRGMPPEHPHVAAVVTTVAQPATLGTPGHEDPEMAGKPWTEDTMLRVLWRHFASQSWATIPQVTISQRDLGMPRGYSADEATDRRIDMLAVRKPRRTGLGSFETLAIEVKVTRADFLADVRRPEKQAAWRQAATRHTYAVPAGLVTADEVPEGSGLLAVKHGPQGWGEVEWVRRAPYVDGHRPQLPPRVAMTVLYRLAMLEAHTRGWNATPEVAGTPQELRAAITAANRVAEKATRDLARIEGQRDAWKHAYVLASHDGHPCEWCGRPVKPLNPGRDGFRGWRHVDLADDAPCGLAETYALEEQARADYAAADADERDWRTRSEIRHGSGRRVDEVEREPWRAFLRVDYRDSKVRLSGARPSGGLPAETMTE